MRVLQTPTVCMTIKMGSLLLIHFELITHKTLHRKQRHLHRSGSSTGCRLFLHGEWESLCTHQNVSSARMLVQELCESRGGRPGLSVLTSLLVSVDVKNYWTLLRHWSQLVPNMSTDIWGHKASIHHHQRPLGCAVPVGAESGQVVLIQRCQNSLGGGRTLGIIILHSNIVGQKPASCLGLCVVLFARKRWH